MSFVTAASLKSLNSIIDFMGTLLRRGSQLGTVCFIIARAAADGPLGGR